MADYQQSFNMYLSVLEQRTRMEADQYARKQMEKKQLIQGLFTAGAQAIDAIEKNNDAKAQYQTMAKQTGELEKWRGMTNEEQGLMQQHSALMNSLKRNETSMRAKIEDLNFKIPYESEQSAVKEIIEKPIAHYKQTQAMLASQLSEVENKLKAYKGSPQYQIDSDNVAFDNLFKHARLNSAKYYETMGGSKTQPNQMEAYKQKADIDVNKQARIQQLKGSKADKISGLVDKLRGMSVDIDKQYLDDETKYAVKKKIAEGIDKLGSVADPDKYYSDLNAEVLNAMNPEPGPTPETRKQKKERLKREEATAQQKKLEAMSGMLDKFNK